jgi:perosamine synthetase
MNKIPIFEPYVARNQALYLAQCVEQNWISSKGPFLEKFKLQLENIYKGYQCVLTSNCTTALHLSLNILDLSASDEVICPALTFIAPANMVLLSGSKLVLVDIEKDSLNISLENIKKAYTKNTKVVIYVHQFGNSSEIKEIADWCKINNITLVEDIAEAFLTKYQGKYAGRFGDIATLSFFGNKYITTGEGGALLIKDPALFARAGLTRDHGMQADGRYIHERLGFNYRMTNLQAAVGLAQLDDIEIINRIRNQQLALYTKLLEGEPMISMRKFSSDCIPSHWLTTIFLDSTLDRNALQEELLKAGIESRIMIRPVNQALHIKKMIPDSFEWAVERSSKGMHLPSGTSLSSNQIHYICKTLRELLPKCMKK